MSTILELLPGTSAYALRVEVERVRLDMRSGRLPFVPVRDLQHRDAVLRTTRILAERVTGEHRAA